MSWFKRRPAPLLSAFVVGLAAAMRSLGEWERHADGFRHLATGMTISVHKVDLDYGDSYTKVVLDPCQTLTVREQEVLIETYREHLEYPTQAREAVIRRTAAATVRAHFEGAPLS